MNHKLIGIILETRIENDTLYSKTFEVREGFKLERVDYNKIIETADLFTNGKQYPCRAYLTVTEIETGDILVDKIVVEENATLTKAGELPKEWKHEITPQ